MYHKFKDYNRNEQREIVFEIIRQKYLHNPNLNNFGNNTKYLINLVRAFQADQITISNLKLKLEEFNNKLEKEDADEILFYFYNISDANAEKGNTKFSAICKILNDIIDVDAISNTIQTPEDKISDIDNRDNKGFSVVTYGKYPSPTGYTPPPPPPPKHNFKNPYTSKDFKSICDYVRYKIFDEIIDNHIATLEDLGDLDAGYSFMPDSDEFVKFPQVECDGEEEDLDFENPGEYVINDENSITFGGGGDWQEPKTFSMKMQNGKIKAFDIHDGYDDGDTGAEETIKIICKLFGLNKEDYDPNSTNPNDLATLYNDMVANKDFKLKIVKDITTEDCINAIVKEFPNESQEFLNTKNWKRLMKKGSIIVKRLFQNKVTKDIVEVTSTKTEFRTIKIV